MALINANKYSFNSRQGVLDFIAPLISEGYPVAIQTVYEDHYWDKDRIDHYEVSIGEKRKPIEVMVETEDEKFDFVDPDVRDAFERGEFIECRLIKFSPGEEHWIRFSKNTAVEGYKFNPDFEYRLCPKE